ncbi:hypothetical protein ADP71_17430 [Vitreoscilla sp. C1]|uniref:hypothetical protein n=1 Tax=Vitreoscilla sp. (strain C1) TaxID=96942 RepID=UPI00148EC954|nr:hypothetical protein [Vitreoscilla sp. C1]AUZ05270.2 hypothetical protein ADP71_17430 [Vitreoscilla sp. C1]
MLTITSLVTEYRDTHVTTLLDEVSLEALFIEAVHEYQAWAALKVEQPRLQTVGEVSEWVSDEVVVNANTTLSASEWGIIKPLAYFYVERQEALVQEASKNHMHELFGRTSSEIEQDITAYRNDQLRRLAFRMPIITV